MKKLGLSKNDLDDIISLPNKSFHDYQTNYDTLQKFKIFVKIAVKLKIFTPVLYEKYFG